MVGRFIHVLLLLLISLSAGTGMSTTMIHYKMPCLRTSCLKWGKTMWKSYFHSFPGFADLFFSIQNLYIKIAISQLLGSILNQPALLPSSEHQKNYKMMGSLMEMLPLPARPFPKQFIKPISWKKNPLKTSQTQI